MYREAPIVQRIERIPAEDEMQVQFLLGAQKLFGGLAEWQCTALEKRRAKACTGSTPVPSA